MKRRTILTSVLIIVLCLGLIAGSTYALFTSESKVNIAVTSGKVSIVASLKDLTIYSADATPTPGNPVVDKMDPTDTTGTLTGTFAGTYYYKELTGTTFTNGGEAILSDSDQLLTLSKVTPGDKVALKVQIDNDSNVKIKYRVRVNVLEENDEASSIKLFNGLVTKIDGTVLDGVIRVTNWTSVEADNNNIADIPVEIYLPIDAGNEYQDKVTKISILVEAVQDNAATRTELEAINGYLATLPTKNPTMYDAIKSLVGANIAGLETLATYDDAFAKVMDCLWNVDTDRFYVESDEEGFGYKYFKAYTYDEFDALTTPKYSIYAYDAVGTGTPWAGQDVTVKVGFDAGATVDITSVTFDRSAESIVNESVIRTNSFNTALTIKAPIDTVKHYGSAGTLNIIVTANQSYHEFGKIAFADISKGRMVIEEGAKVNNLHISSIKEVVNNQEVTTNEFDSIIIAIAENAPKPTFSRDDVEIAQNGTLVVAIQKGTETVTEETPLDYVWLTKQGIFEQIKVTENEDVIKETDKWADDVTVENKTQEAAFEIANNIGRNDSTNKVEANVEVNNTPYVVTLDETTRELVVTDTNSDPVVNAQVESDAIVEAVINTGVSTSDIDNMDEIIEKAISEDAKADNHIVRIGSTYYDTFEEAYVVVKSGDTIRVLADCTASYHDNAAYDFSGKNVNIFVEEGATLACGDVTNGKFNIGWNNAIGTLTLEGPGKITFDANNTWALVKQNGSGNNINVVVKDITIEAISGNGYVADANLTVESGYFKNITFKQNDKIIGGYFTTDVTDNLVEGKMLTTSDVTGYSYKVTALDAAHANFSVLHGEELSYFSTLGGVDENTVSGDVVTFIGVNSIVMVDGGQNKFNVNDGVTYDLNGHTIQATGSAYAFYMGKGNKTITMKNGTIDATNQLCEENSIYTFVVNAENLRINSKILDDTKNHIYNAIIEMEDTNFFTIVSEIPNEYKAKIDRTNYTVYFTGTYGVADALTMIKNGETVYTYSQLEFEGTNISIDLIIGNSFTVVVDENIDFPDVLSLKSKTGKVSKGTPSGNTTIYTIVEAPVCQIVGGNSYLTFKEGFEALGNNQTLKILEDITIYQSVSMTQKAYGKTYTIDFNGHTITCSGNAKIYNNLSGNSTSSKFYLTDSVGGGGIVSQDPNSNYVIIQQAKQGSIFIQSGKYEVLSGNPFNFNSSQIWTIEGGIINCLPLYEDTIKGHVKVGCTITLNGVEYTRTDS